MRQFKNEIKAVLFDLHGTLVHYDHQGDLHQERAQTAYELFHRYLPHLDPERVKAAWLAAYDAWGLEERSYVDRARVTLRWLGYEGEIEEAAQEIAASYVETWLAGLIMPPENLDVLRRLKESYRLGLVTNYQEPAVIPHILDRFGLSPLLECVIISAEHGWRKPYPSIFQEALAALHVQPEETVFVGDDPDVDIKGAQAAGMRPILIDLEGRYPDHQGMRIRSLLELLEII